LAKAAGLATMISTMRPDIDNIDEYVRNTTARAFAVVASALGIPSLLPFLKVNLCDVLKPNKSLNFLFLSRRYVEVRNRGKRAILVSKLFSKLQS
jgi:hypothetical protein